VVVYALLAVAAVFTLLWLVRVLGARRAALIRHAASIALGGAALFLMLRGQVALALGLALAAAVVWFWTAPAPARAARMPMAEAEARAILGVGPNAGRDEIRAAYRARMARAHPDRGGTTQEAARLNAARDVLLKR
jgi:hypothetical protein